MNGIDTWEIPSRFLASHAVLVNCPSQLEITGVAYSGLNIDLILIRGHVQSHTPAPHAEGYKLYRWLVA